MNQKMKPLIIGLVLIISLAIGGSVYAQAGTHVVHQTGDVLIYGQEGTRVDSSYSSFEIYDEDQGLTANYDETWNDNSNSFEGTTFISLVEVEDLTHLPAEFDPSNDPDFPEDVSLLGALIETEGTGEGSGNWERNEFRYEDINNTDAGWFNHSDVYSYGPENFRDRSQQGGFATADFSFLPSFDDNGDMDPFDIIEGVNFTTTEYFDFPLFGDNSPWVQMEVNITFGFFSFIDASIDDGVGGSINVDIYGMEAYASGTSTNINVQVPLGDDQDPSTPWIDLNATVSIEFSSYMEMWFDRDTQDGLFLGFYEEEDEAIWGSMEAINETIFFPHDESLGLDNHNVTISMSGEFSMDRIDTQDIFLDEFIPSAARVGTNAGLETGDELHYTVEEDTYITSELTAIVGNDGPDGPDVENPVYETQNFDASVEADADMWLSVYTHNADRIGFVTETLFGEIIVTGFEDPNEGTLSLNQGGDGPEILYLFDIVTLISGKADSGLGSNADQELVLNVNEDASVGMSALFEMGDDRDNGDGDGGPLGFIFGLTQMLGIDLRAPKVSDVSDTGIGNITINEFDYVVAFNNRTLTYEIILEGSVPFNFDEGPNDGGPGGLMIDQDGPPPAFMDYYIELTVEESRYYDDDTGALLFLDEETELYVETSIFADFTEIDPNLGEVLIIESIYSYDYEIEYLLEGHSHHYQEAQDPADIPTSETTDETTDSTDPTDTTNTNDTDTETATETPELGLPGFGFIPAILGSGFMVTLIRRRK